MSALSTLTIAFVISVLVNLTIIVLSKKFSFLHKNPSQDRWHTKPIAHFGGVGIFLGFFVVAILSKGLDLSQWIMLLAGLAIFLLGLMDDAFKLSAQVKMLFQLIISALLAFYGFHFTMTDQAWVYIPATIFWLILLTNAFNLVDNMDGLCSGLSLISLVFLILSNRLGSAGLFENFLFGLLGSTAGFFVFNVHPAKILMGDSGSLFLGFMFAVFSIMGSWKMASNLFLIFVIPFLLFVIPIFDTILVTINRKMHGLPVTLGGKDHTSHRLVALGFSQKTTVVMLWALAILFASIALFAGLVKTEILGLILGFFIVFIITFGFILTDTKVYQINTSQNHFTPLKTNVFFKRKIFEMIMDAFFIVASFYIAYLLKYDFELDLFIQNQFYKTLPYVFVIKLIVFSLLGLYKGHFSYFHFYHLRKIFWAVLISSLACVLCVLALHRFVMYSRALFVIDFIVALSLVLGSRVFLRWFRETLIQKNIQSLNVLLIGSHSILRYLITHFKTSIHIHLKPIAILTHEKNEVGSYVRHVPIVGLIEDFDHCMKSMKIDRVLMVENPLLAKQYRDIEEKCRSLGVKYYTMGPIEDLILNKLS